MKIIRKMALLLCLLAVTAPCAPVQADIVLPVPGEGETLYVGSAKYDQIDSFQVAFVLSEDGEIIHDLTVIIQGMHLTVSHGFSSSKVGVESSREKYNGDYPMAEGEIFDMGDLRLEWIALSGETITAAMEYTFSYREGGRLDGEEIEVPFEPREVVFERKE